MPTTDPIVITPSTSVVLVNTADFSGNPIVLLPNIDSLGRVITIRDADGGSLTKPIYISTTDGAQFQQEISTVTISSLVITQPYGFYTITPRTVGPSGTRYGIMNAFAFRESSDYAYVNMFNTNMGYVSTLSTINLEVNQDINVLGNINVTGSINYTNPGSVTFNADVVNTRDIGVSTIKSATIYTSTAYASSIYLANTLEASTMRLTSRPVFDLSGSSTWSNYMSGGTDPNSMTLGNPSAGAGAQIGTGTEFFGIRSFSKAGINNFSTSILARYGNVGINYPYTDITYSGGQPNYTLSVNGALRLSNSDTRPQQSNIIFKANGQVGSSNRYINTFGATDTNYTLYSANNETHGFYDSGSQYQWITADKGASYPETIKFWTGNNEERMQINSTGDVGIGTTSPGVRLDVSGGSIRQNGPTNNIPIVIGDDNTAGNASFELGKGRGNNGSAYVDLTSATGETDYNARIIRNSGVNGSLDIIQKGTGYLNYSANSVDQLTVDNSGLIVKTGLSLADGTLARPTLNFRQGTGTDENTGLYHPATDTIGLITGGVERVRFDDVGKVGIATLSPAYTLDVSGSAAVRNALALNEGSAAAPALNFAVGTYAGTGTGLYQPAANVLGFTTLGAEKARIDSVGYFGIGTTSPDTFLDVFGNSVFGTGRFIQAGSASANTNPVLRLQNADTGTPTHQINFHTNLTASAYNGLTQAGDKGIIFSEGGSGNGNLVIAPWVSGAYGLRITSNGQVGIGQAIPTQVLDVSGSIKITTSIMLPDGTVAAPALCFTDDTDTGIYSPANGVVAITADGLERMRINASWQVGIGKSAGLTYNLDVSGLIGANGLYVNAPGATGIYMSNANAIYGKNTSGTDQLCLIPRNSDNNTYLNYGTGGFFYVRNNLSANKFIVGDTAQYMYFGESGISGNPVYTYFDTNSIQIGVNRLTNGNAYIDLISDSTNTDYGLRIVREAGANSNSIIAHKGTNPLIITAQDAGYLSFRTQDSERMRIDSTGNVGIGITPSGYKLDVNGSSFLRSDVYFGANTTSGFMRMVIDSGTSYIQSSSNTSGTHNKLYFTGYAGSNITMVLDIPNRRVGIGGQISPTVVLDVSGDIKASGNITAYSDERFKTNIHPIVNALEKVAEMRGISYTTKGGGHNRIGVIAQEIEKIIPEVVLTDDTENHYKSVDYGNIVAVLIEAIKELKAKVDALSSAS